MGLNSTTILFIITGLLAIVVIAMGYYMYRTDMFGGKTVYNLEKRLSNLERKVYIEQHLEENSNIEEAVVNSEVEVPTIYHRQEISKPTSLPNPLELLLGRNNMVAGMFESEEEITKEIDDLRKQLEQNSNPIEVLSDIEEKSNENSISSGSNLVTNSDQSVKTNGNINTEEDRELIHDYDDLGDLEHIENNELENYINNSSVENSDEIEKKLEEMSNTSQVDADVTYNVRIELISNSSKLKDIKELCKKNGISIGSSSKTELVRKLYKINPNIYDLLVANKDNSVKENTNTN